MRRRISAAAGACLTALVLAMAVLLVCGLAGARINTSRSIPVGLYWTSAAPVVKGAYVMFCPPDRDVFALGLHRHYLGPGECPGGYGYVMKRVAASRQDKVAIGLDGVRVNGAVLPFSIPLDRDGEGRPLPRREAEVFVLGDDELLLMTDISPTSFDGRYFGPVSRSQIVTAIKPVLTW